MRCALVRRRFPRVAALALASSLLQVPGAITAQTSGDLDRPRLGLSAGADMRGANGAGTLWLAQASAQWSTALRGLGVRAELLYGGRRAEGSEIYPIIDVPCPIEGCVNPSLSLATRVRAFGAGVSGTYDFLRDAKVRPYLISGIGFLITERRTTTAAFYPPCAYCMLGRPLPQTTRLAMRSDVSNSTTAMALNGGAGVVLDVGRLQLYTELRYMLNDDRQPAGISGIIPLTVGVRF